jgi:hypothetical protein
MTESSFGPDAAAPGGGAVTVTLRSLDDAPFVLPLEAARLSEMCAQALPEDGAEEDVTSVEPIDILRVRKQVRRAAPCRALVRSLFPGGSSATSWVD